MHLKPFQVGIPPEEVYAEVLPNHKKEKVAALQKDGSKVSSKDKPVIANLNG